jgi:D-alanyl-D-alanine carboxypeptidase
VGQSLLRPLVAGLLAGLPIGIPIGLLVGCSAAQDVGTPAAATPTTAPASGGAASKPHRSQVPPARPPFDRGARSTTDPASIWVVVNKTHPIAASYRPEITLVRGYQVAVPAAVPLTRLLDDGDAAGLGLKIASAFRSYAYQASVHEDVVAAQGPVAADRISARPGYSEHQTGLAVDLVTPATPACDFEQCFATTPAGRWLARHSWEYGFIVRYTVGNERVTGYAPEPWHLRYVGRALATAMHDAGISTLEEFLDVPGGGYRSP